MMFYVKYIISLKNKTKPYKISLENSKIGNTNPN